MDKSVALTTLLVILFAAVAVPSLAQGATSSAVLDARSYNPLTAYYFLRRIFAVQACRHCHIVCWPCSC